MRRLQLTADYLDYCKPFIPQTKENRAALRTAVAALVAVLLAFKLHLDKPYWSGMTTVILANIYTGTIIDKAMMRIAGTIFGALFGYFLAGFIANSFFLYIFMSFMLVAIAVYHYNFSIYAYAWLLAAISAFIVISELAINPDEAFKVAVWRPIEIGLGVLVSAATAFCLFPEKIHIALAKEVDELFDGFSELLKQLEGCLLQQNDAGYDELSQQLYLFKKKVKKAAEMICFMRRELGFKREKIDQFRLLLDSFYDLTRVINYFVLSNQSTQNKEGLSGSKLPVADVFNALNQDLQSIKRAFLIHSSTLEALKTAKRLQAIDQIIALPSLKPANKQQSELEAVHMLRQMNDKLISLGMLFTEGHLVNSTKANLISRQRRLQNDPDIIKHSIKAGLSVILALLFWLVSNWPGGLNGIISSIVISIRKNIYEMKNISLYRVLGCLAGGGLALFALSYCEMNLYDLIIVVFFAVWGFSYFSFKYSNYAYIGLQANIALIITLAQGGGPPSHLSPPLERLGGIFIGIAATFIVANAIWRTDLLSMLGKRIQKLYRYLLYNLRQLLTNIDDKAQLYDLTTLFWFCRGLMETLDDENLNPKKQALLEQAKYHFQKLVFLQATLTHINVNVDQKRAMATLAACQAEPLKLKKAVCQLYDTETAKEEDCCQLGQELEVLMEKLTSSPTDSTWVKPEEVENTVAYLGCLIQLVHIAKTK